MKIRLAGLAALALSAGLAAPEAGAFELPKVPNLFGDSQGEQPAPGATLDCPVIVLEDGLQMLRFPANADSASVHHQLSIKSTARECIVDGDHVMIKVGVEGDAMLGPVGAAGAYGGTIKIALRRTKDDSIVSSKNYRVNATIPAGGARADFRLLADPISAPPSAKPQDEYEILIGFTEGGADAAEKPARAKKKGRR